MRELALVGANRLTERDAEGADRAVGLRRLAAGFTDPAHAGVDWHALREGKRHAWPAG